MAKSKYEYVKMFEQNDSLLPNTFIVIRVDGQNFHRFSGEHGFQKPNDLSALKLMNHASFHVMQEFGDIFLAYGQSDEFSFVLKRTTTIHGRRSSKLSSMIASLFTSAYVMNWSLFFPQTPLKYPPSFDARAICYPSEQNIQDYFSWRQVDCHINNMYNLCFWSLVDKGGKTHREAESILMTTNSAGKNELLFSSFNINYNNVDEIFRKGTIIYREKKSISMQDIKGKSYVKEVLELVQFHGDIIKDDFWTDKINIKNL